MKFSLYIRLMLVTLISCSETTVSELDDVPFEVSYFMKELYTDSGYVGPVAVGEIENRQIDEASGLAVSRSFKDHLWTHNDSGEVQGEAIAWTKTGESYFTLSESKGIIPVLYRYDKKRTS